MTSTGVAMRGFVRSFLVCFFVVLTAAGTAQMRSSLNGTTFRNEKVGLTYTLPRGFAPDPKLQIPQDPHGHELIILALWDIPRRTPVPRVTFLYDTRERPAWFTPDQAALRYLRSFEPEQDYKMSEPKKVSIAGNMMWRLDYWHPDDSGQSYNSAIVIPCKDRKLLIIQMNAPTQSKLDFLIDSLRELRFDRK